MIREYERRKKAAEYDWEELVFGFRPLCLVMPNVEIEERALMEAIPLRPLRGIGGGGNGD
jgi:hypothetical protein